MFMSDSQRISLNDIATLLNNGRGAKEILARKQEFLLKAVEAFERGEVDKALQLVERAQEEQTRLEKLRQRADFLVKEVKDSYQVRDRHPSKFDYGQDL
jgi:hypothetical protein